MSCGRYAHIGKPDRAPPNGRVGAEMKENCVLDASRAPEVIDGETRFVAAGAASNGVGAVHNVAALCQAAKELSQGRALTFVDASRQNQKMSLWT